MRYIDIRIQEPFLRRRGFRGRRVTCYLHRYNGMESTERFHTHPWALAVGIVLRGWMYEAVGNEGTRCRNPLSVRWYTRSTSHRVVGGNAVTLFFGFGRSQKKIERAAEFSTKEGYCHYTELLPFERVV